MGKPFPNLSRYPIRTQASLSSRSSGMRILEKDRRELIVDRYTLNVWDVGGQRTLRPYWRNYFESTDAVVWVVDSSDRLRVGDCKDELRTLLQEEVSHTLHWLEHPLDDLLRDSADTQCRGCLVLPYSSLPINRI